MLKKTKTLLTATMLLLAGCSGIYEPGDMYTRDGETAIVVTVDADNQPEMLMSLEEAVSINADSALRWAETLGEGWRLPDEKEIAKIYRVKTLINITLERKGKSKVMENFTYYWSATPCSETHTYACGPDGVGCYFSENDVATYRARAVKKICVQGSVDN